MGTRAIVAGATALLLAAGWATADALDVAPGFLTVRPVIPEPQPYPVPTASPAAPVIAAGDAAPAGEVQPVVDALGADLGDVSVTVVDVATGEAVGELAADVPRIPASSLKLLTATAALSALGPGRTLTTSATWDGATLTLVGGGDLLLGVGEPQPGAVGHASLTELAGRTAGHLRGEGVTAVRLAVDDTLFTGPPGAPDWGSVDWQFVMPMAPLAVDSGTSVGDAYDADPAMAATLAFAGELAAAGVTVEGQPVRAPSPAGATTIAEVESAPIADVVEWTVKVSENSLAEALGRLVAIARGLPGSVDGATAAVLAELGDLGVDTAGTVLRDTSGLSGGNRLTARVLTEVLALPLDPAHSRLTGLLASLPVSQLDGTLADRVPDAPGVVRAKTGTLATVVSLSGMVQTDGGAVLLFSVIVPDVPPGGVGAARARVDRFVADLAAT